MSHEKEKKYKNEEGEAILRTLDTRNTFVYSHKLEPVCVSMETAGLTRTQRNNRFERARACARTGERKREREREKHTQNWREK